MGEESSLIQTPYVVGISPYFVVEAYLGPPKRSPLTTICRWKVYVPFVFGNLTVSGSAYLDTLQLWLLPHLKESEPDTFIWQQDGAQWHLSVRDWLNITVPGQWIFHKRPHDKACSAWPPHSPDLTSCDFYLFNGDRYRAMITNFFIPELNNHDVQELWFQQDGATCHTARATIDLLKDTLGDRLISRFGSVNWPPRSCDLTPLDYFL
ncbi:uncharacterized protein TNCV_563421 [Trichonephila clavipes]|nr:uncharacterized protein TNCV_563421 [Trichonephila clavipes]